MRARAADGPLALATLAFLVGLPLGAPVAAQESGERTGESATIGMVQATIDGEERNYPVIGPRGSGSSAWGSGWRSYGGVLYLTLWGADGDVDEVTRDDADVVLSLTFMKRDAARESRFQPGDPVRQRCNPMDDRIEFYPEGDRGRDILVGDGDCGGIKLEEIRFLEEGELYVLEGRFAGTLSDTGATVSDGRFEARIPRRPR